MDGDKRGRRSGSERTPPPTYDDIALRLRSLVAGTADTNIDEVVDEPADDDGGDEDTMPLPPSYEEAVAAPSHYAPSHYAPAHDPTDHDDTGAGQPDGATGGVVDLSADEAAIVLRMQEDKDYMPKRRKSIDEAMEMLGYHSEEEEEEITEVDEPQPRLHTVDTVGRASSIDSLEEGGDRSRHRPQTSIAGALMVVAAIVFIIGFILFLGLFPASFVYVEYYEIALAKSKMTNYVDRDTVYYPGCYILGPDTTLVRFKSTACEISEELSVFTMDTISITMKYSLQYFLRPEEVGSLYTKFVQDYDSFFQKVVTSTIRNTAAMSLTVEQFRFNRTQVEQELHAKLRERLGGTCCPGCCKKRTCQSNAYCSQCKQGDCEPGYHIDVRYFYLTTVGISSEVFQQYLRRNVLQIEEEREYFLQEYAVTMKDTLRLTTQHENNAKEILSNARAQSHLITIEAATNSEQIVQAAYARALKGLFSLLNVTEQEHQLSLMMIRALEDVSWNLYPGYGYHAEKMYAP